MAAELPPHGGDLALASLQYGAPRDGWLDLSTGINPSPYPLPALPGAVWSRLPQSDASARALAAARRYYRVPEAAEILPLPGTQAAIQWLPRLIARSDVTVLGPTYAEHALAWSAAGHAVREVEDWDDTAEAPVVVLSNPNNPDGRRLAPETILARARGDQQPTLIVVDEAFADVDPAASIVPDCGAPELAVLRSFGKFFGLGGLRLGFLIGAPALIGAVRDVLGPWAVSGPALTIADVALQDEAWIEATREALRQGRQQMDDLFAEAGVAVIGGTDLFRLVEDERAPALHAHLAAAGILTRIFDYAPHWIRFGLPGRVADFDRLRAALKSFVRLSLNSARSIRCTKEPKTEPTRLPIGPRSVPRASLQANSGLFTASSTIEA